MSGRKKVDGWMDLDTVLVNDLYMEEPQFKLSASKDYRSKL